MSDICSIPCHQHHGTYSYHTFVQIFVGTIRHRILPPHLKLKQIDLHTDDSCGKKLKSFWDHLMPFFIFCIAFLAKKKTCLHSSSLCELLTYVSPYSNYCSALLHIKHECIRIKLSFLQQISNITYYSLCFRNVAEEIAGHIKIGRVYIRHCVSHFDSLAYRRFTDNV